MYNAVNMGQNRDWQVMDILLTASRASVGECLTTDPGYEMTHARSIDGMEFDVDDNDDGTSSLYFEGEE